MLNKKKLLARYMNGDKYIQLSCQHVKKLGCDEAVLLAFLFNHAMITKAFDQNEGWFFCQSELIENTIGFKANKQWRLLKSLKDKEVVRYRDKWNPRRRWIKLRLKQIRMLTKEI